MAQFRNVMLFGVRIGQVIVSTPQNLKATVWAVGSNKVWLNEERELLKMFSGKRVTVASLPLPITEKRKEKKDKKSIEKHSYD